jgi:hypothetical protein
MAPWTFNVKFPYGTQFTFGSLTFVAGEDRNLKMLPLGSAPERSCRYMDKLHVFGHLIYNSRYLFKFGSLCRAAYPHHQACSGYSDHDVYPPTIGWGIELVLIGSVP